MPGFPSEKSKHTYCMPTMQMSGTAIHLQLPSEGYILTFSIDLLVGEVFFGVFKYFWKTKSLIGVSLIHRLAVVSTNVY